LDLDEIEGDLDLGGIDFDGDLDLALEFDLDLVGDLELTVDVGLDLDLTTEGDLDLGGTDLDCDLAFELDLDLDGDLELTTDVGLDLGLSKDLEGDLDLGIPEFARDLFLLFMNGDPDLDTDDDLDPAFKEGGLDFIFSGVGDLDLTREFDLDLFPDTSLPFAVF